MEKVLHGERNGKKPLKEKDTKTRKSEKFFKDEITQIEMNKTDIDCIPFTAFSFPGLDIIHDIKEQMLHQGVCCQFQLLLIRHVRHMRCQSRSNRVVLDRCTAQSVGERLPKN